MNQKIINFFTEFYQTYTYPGFPSLILLVYPATVLSVPKLNGLIFAVLVILGITEIIRTRESVFNASKNELYLYSVVVVFFIVALLLTLYSGFVYKPIGKFLYILLIIPLYVYFRNRGIKHSYFWYGLAIGAVVAAFVTAYDIYILNERRAHGITHPIIFASIALMLGGMCMSGVSWFKRKVSWKVVIPVVALICSLFAVILSQSRGVWVALPFLLLIVFLYARKSILLKFQIAFFIALIVLISIIYVVPQTGVRDQVVRTINSLELYSGSEINSHKRTTSVGKRLEMWQAAWDMFKEKPLIGIGWGHYHEELNKQIDMGLRNESVGKHVHPHNQFLSALASGGVIGFIITVLLFLVPIWLFVRLIKNSSSEQVKSLALAGVVLIVGYMVFGLSEAILERARPVNFFAFYLAAIMAAIHSQQFKINSKKSA